jgi:hypothetical protein
LFKTSSQVQSNKQNTSSTSISNYKSLNSNQRKEERPSTAPTKEKNEKIEKNEKQIRLPSPQLKQNYSNKGSYFQSQEKEKRNSILNNTAYFSSTNMIKYGNGNGRASSNQTQKGNNGRFENSSSFKGFDSRFKI